MNAWDERKARARQRRLEQEARLPTITARMSEEDRRCNRTPEGWEPLLLRLDAELAAIDPDYVIGQHKEKWGYLCVHASPKNPAVRDEFYAVIKKYKEESQRTCQDCGKPGKTSRTGGRVDTLCNEHWATRSPKKQIAAAIQLLKDLQQKIAEEG